MDIPDFPDRDFASTLTNVTISLEFSVVSCYC